MMSIYDASSVIHAIPEYKTSKYGIIKEMHKVKYVNEHKWGGWC